ncbi:Flavohemoprotein [Polystyrenella longa]|uniref:Flavohemoprotein n=1 Tax=Polystyrenella longa TaxID=2528007 RepID=A0A518CT25_9PLAN|nr:globin [Polystyrenella longa]QDU82379.1 Flavohemoprotein [Polystyrenella longa]
MLLALELMPVPMTTVETVRESYARCRQNPDFFDAFYDHFARKSSEIGPLFSNTDMQKQNELLSDAIVSLISFAKGDSAARQHIEEIRLSHDRYQLNIKPKWYPFWIEALLDTIKESDPDCTPELLENWQTVIQPGIDHILSFHSGVRRDESAE